MKWQPMKTSPKDGTKVLAFFPRSKSIRVAWYKKFLLDGWLWAYDADMNQEAGGMIQRGQPDRAKAELLGAINYLAACVLLIEGGGQ